MSAGGYRTPRCGVLAFAQKHHFVCRAHTERHSTLGKADTENRGHGSASTTTARVSPLLREQVVAPCCPDGALTIWRRMIITRFFPIRRYKIERTSRPSEDPSAGAPRRRAGRSRRRCGCPLPRRPERSCCHAGERVRPESVIRTGVGGAHCVRMAGALAVVPRLDVLSRASVVTLLIGSETLRSWSLKDLQVFPMTWKDFQYIERGDRRL